jgi:hypothetical protein
MSPAITLPNRPRAAILRLTAVAWLGGCSLMTTSALAAPATYWTGVRASSQLSYTLLPPGSQPVTVESNQSETRYPLAANDPARGTDLSARVHGELAAIGLTGDASARAQMGVLKSWSAVQFDGPQPGNSFHFAASSGWASFGDTLLVDGPGLAAGTAVTYTIDIDVHALFLQGTNPFNFYAQADLTVSAEDVDTGQQRSFSWSPGLPTTGLAGGHFRWDYQTSVGRSFVLSAYLNTRAVHNASVAGTASADLGHTVRLSIDNSDTRLSTVGMSGHDWRLGSNNGGGTVPLPASPWLAALGLLALAQQRRMRRVACA